MKFNNYKHINGIAILSKISPKFSDNYLALRRKENRVLTDDEVQLLPITSKQNPNNAEWKVRLKTANRFIKYLHDKNQKLTILDIGCGNGWFTNKMFETGNKVTGLDVNLEELEQANRIFKLKNNSDLNFIYTDIFKTKTIFKNKFDIITLNANIQYFPDFELLIQTIKTFLKPSGEIHILDSPFYEVSEINYAKNRTLSYYTKMGFPEMTKFYYHHSKEKIKDFEILYQPKNNIFNKILGKKDSPFMWLRMIKKHN